jgi:hypothetical protein
VDSLLTLADLYDSTHHQGGHPDANPQPPPNSKSLDSPQGGPRDANPLLAPKGLNSSAPLQVGPGGKSANPAQKTTKGNPPTKTSLYAPFPNLSSYELGEWFYGQSGKSLRDFRALVEILTSPDFSINDIRATKWTGVFRDLGKNKEEMSLKRSAWVDDEGWKTSPVEIEVPIHDQMEDGCGVEKHVMGMLYHRSIVSIVQEKIMNANDSRLFHQDGFELLWKPGGEDAASPEFRVLSELYHSDAFLNAQKEVRQSPPPQIKDCKLPRVVVALMFWSDATQISTFSPKKLWPLYMLFGNESKHGRGKKASESLGDHVAYFDTVSLLYYPTG